ncbi:MAG TPA: hypothetical protein VG714_09065 [Acidobacteriaceae bacterium]|nr:hypothetical protein [Acidobacteriaceae bacterium]
MNGTQIENLLSLMEESIPLDKEKARRELAEYLTNNMADVAAELLKSGEVVIRTESGTFRLTKEDLVAA